MSKARRRLIVLFLAGLGCGVFACSSTGDSSSNPSGSSGGSSGSPSSSGSGGSSGKASSSGGSGSSSGGSGGSSGGSGGSSGGSGGSSGGSGSSSGGSGGSSGGSSGGGSSGGGDGGPCTNTNTGAINEDASGFVCNNKWGIQGAWYCYSDGSDTTISCKGSDGKGNGANPWNPSSKAMCLSGTMGTGTSSFAGIGFKVNSGPPGSTATPGTWNGSSIVGFAITLAPGASNKGSGGMILNLEYPTTTDLDSNTKDAPGVTVPGVPSGSASITYNALFTDSVLANNKNRRTSVDPSVLTDVKVAFFPDSVSHSYDFCITNVVPLMTAPNPVVATGSYGPTWTNQMPQAVNGINGYAVQSAPFPTNGNPMTMQVMATSGGVGFTYMAGGGFSAQNNGPGSFPAIISGWGPGHDGIQFYGPYKGGKTIGQLQSVTSTWTFSMGSTGDAVYDVWFSNASTQPPPVPGIELMVWIGNTGKNALGNKASPGTAVAGRTPYVGTNGTGESVVSYWVASPGATSASNIDLLQYFKDAATNGYAGLKTSSTLLGIQAGFEVYSGNWSTSNYNINIQ
jgi:hypothetical protein